MEEEYELRPVKYRGEVICSELVSAASAKSELQKTMEGDLLPPELVNLFNQITKIKKYGVKKACTVNLLHHLDSSCNLFEIKNYSGVRREMSCIITRRGNEIEIVLLFEFVGHQGTNKIRSKTLKRAERMARKAKQLVLSEGGQS